MIELNLVTKKIKDKTVLEDISLKLEKGKIYLLKGHNGSGKTMLLRLLCDLLNPTSGEVKKKEYTYGVMIENPSFMEYETARQNLKFLASIQKKINMKDIEEALDKVNLLSVADNKVKGFSLGMKQRLGFCQAIMEKPDVLLLDEPFNALDDEHFNLILTTIEEMKENRIIVIAAHGFNMIEHPIFDEIISLSNGKITNIEKI